MVFPYIDEVTPCPEELGELATLPQPHPEGIKRSIITLNILVNRSSTDDYDEALKAITADPKKTVDAMINIDDKKLPSQLDDSQKKRISRFVQTYHVSQLATLHSALESIYEYIALVHRSVISKS